MYAQEEGRKRDVVQVTKVSIRIKPGWIYWDNHTEGILKLSKCYYNLEPDSREILKAWEDEVAELRREDVA